MVIKYPNVKNLQIAIMTLYGLQNITRALGVPTLKKRKKKNHASRFILPYSHAWPSIT